MKRHYFVQQMNNQQQQQRGTLDGGVYAITPVDQSSKGFDATDGPPDYGIVNIYQKSSRDLKGLGGGKSIYLDSGDDKSDSDSNVTAGGDGDSDIISEYIGHYGLWQFCWTFLLCLFQIPTTFHIFCLVFQVGVGKGIEWCCGIVEIVLNIYYFNFQNSILLHREIEW